MRISDRQRHELVTGRIEKAKSDNASMLDVISSQKRINKVSDDPIGFGRVILDRNKIANLKQFQKNIDFSKGFIERTETSISGMTDFLIRAKELAVGMANDTYGPESREASAREIKEIINAVVNLGNTTYGNRYVFGGFRTQTPPLSQDGTYLGDDGAIFMQMDKDLFQQINVQARELFEPSLEERNSGHFGLIQTLKILYDGLTNNDKHMLHAGMDELEYQMNKATSYQATIGAISTSIQRTQDRLALGEELTAEEMSKVEDADIFKSSSDFQRTETVLQSSLMASQKVMQPSLLNFLQ